MTKTVRCLFLSTVLATSACGSSAPAHNDASGLGGLGGGGGTGAAGAAAAGTAGGGAGTTGTAGGGDAGTPADAAAGATGTAGLDGGNDATDATDATASDAADAASDESHADVPSDAPSSGDTATTATTASRSISATTGGVLTISDGAFTVQAGGLAADTTLSIAASAPTGTTPQAATIIGNVYELGPSGTIFAKPALLSLNLGTIATGKHAVVSTLVANAWVDLPTIVVNGKVYASLSHLSTYAVRGLDDVSCATFNDDLQCGAGTIAGTWNVSAFCNVSLDGSEFPPTDKLLSACAEMGTSTPVTGGSATLNDDLSYTSTIVAPARATLSILLPTGCTGSAASCDAIAGQIVSGGTSFVDAFCTGTPANGCQCTGVYRPPVLPTASTGSYTATGGKLGFTGSIPARSYCANNQSTPQKLFYSWGRVTQTSQFGFIFTK